MEIVNSIGLFLLGIGVALVALVWWMQRDRTG